MRDALLAVLGGGGGGVGGGGCGFFFFFSSRRRHTRFTSDWSSDVCSSDLMVKQDHKSLEHNISSHSSFLNAIDIHNLFCFGKVGESKQYECCMCF